MKKNKDFFIENIWDSLLLPLVALFSKLAAFRENKNTVVMPNTKPGNLGDESLVVATVNFLHKKNKNVFILSQGKGESREWRGIDGSFKEVNIKAYFSRFNSFFYFLQILGFLWKTRACSRLYYLGADTIDGNYSDKAHFMRMKFLYFSEKSGLSVRIISASFNNKPSETAIQSLKNLPPSIKLYSRDPISEERLLRYTSRKISPASDVAFLLEPSGAENKNILFLKKWALQKREERKVLVGLNFSSLLVSKAEDIQANVRVINELSEKHGNLAFILIPHDYRGYKDSWSDKVIADEIFGSPDLRAEVLRVDFLADAREIREIVGLIDICFSCKFHLAISCLSRLVPVACVCYQDKFEGILESEIGITDALIEKNMARDGDRLVRFLSDFLDKRAVNKTKIALKINDLVGRAERVFE